MHNVQHLIVYAGWSKFMINETILDKVLLKIMKHLDSKLVLPVEHQLWSEKEIAKYFNYSEDYTKKNIIQNQYFPPSRQLPTSKDGERTVSRWKAKDVIDFGMAFDKKNIQYH
jgi:hypothetical protein